MADDSLNYAPHRLNTLVAYAERDDGANDESQSGAKRDSDGEEMVAMRGHGFLFLWLIYCTRTTGVASDHSSSRR